MKKELKEKQSSTTEKGFYFTQPENVVMFDNDITSTAKVVYCAILKHVNSKTKKCNLYVKTLAQEVSRSVRTVQRSLTQLINKNLIIRTERYGVDGRNLASCFTVTGPSSGFYSPDAGARVSKPASSKTRLSEKSSQNEENRSNASETETMAEKEVVDMTPTGGTSGGLINYTIDNDIINYSKEGSHLPNSTYSEKEKYIDKNDLSVNPEVKEKNMDKALSLGEKNPPEAAPNIMQPTARYLLMRTKRKYLAWHEIIALRELAATQVPARVQKEIDIACERFERQGRPLALLRFEYIAAVLRDQPTYGRKAKMKAASKAVKAVKENHEDYDEAKAEAELKLIEELQEKYNLV